MSPVVSTQSWNPRYLAYARVHGRTPDDQIAADTARWPGGKMTGYILWNQARLHEFYAHCPEAFLNGHLADHDAYDTFLDRLRVGHGVETLDAS